MLNRVEAFVRASEVWVPDGETMRHYAGVYARDTEFARVSARKTFQKGEGLPGKIRESARCELWEDLGPLFVRRELALAAGINAALGIPVFKDRELSAVVVLLCGKSDETEGCIEVWDAHDEQAFVSHSAGYYGKLRALGNVSPLLQFQAGSGLPGRVLQRGTPLLIDDLRDQAVFTRASLLKGSHIGSGLALPVAREGLVQQVVLLLSSFTTPMARAFEIWRPGERGLRLEQGVHAEGLEGFAALSRGTSYARGEGLPGRVWASGLPAVFDAKKSAAIPNYEGAVRAGLELGIGIPIFDGSSLSSVVVLLS